MFEKSRDRGAASAFALSLIDESSNISRRTKLKLVAVFLSGFNNGYKAARPFFSRPSMYAAVKERVLTNMGLAINESNMADLEATNAYYIKRNIEARDFDSTEELNFEKAFTHLGLSIGRFFGCVELGIVHKDLPYKGEDALRFSSEEEDFLRKLLSLAKAFSDNIKKFHGNAATTYPRFDRKYTPTARRFIMDRIKKANKRNLKPMQRKVLAQISQMFQ